MPLPRPGFWNAPGGGIPVGSTGDAGMDLLNTYMPAGTEFGAMNRGGGVMPMPAQQQRAMPGGAGPQPAMPSPMGPTAAPSPMQTGRRRAVRNRLRGMKRPGMGGVGYGG